MINTGDTAWVLISAALVFIMTPALALFYGGVVRSKNVLSTIMQSLFILAMISVEFTLIGYTMAFGADSNGIVGDFNKLGLAGVGLNVMENTTIPELAFVAFQCMFAALTPALITGAFAERMKFGAFAVLMLLWAILIYNPMAHMVWAAAFWRSLARLILRADLLFTSCPAYRGLLFACFWEKEKVTGKPPSFLIIFR